MSFSVYSFMTAALGVEAVLEVLGAQGDHLPVVHGGEHAEGDAVVLPGGRGGVALQAAPVLPPLLIELGEGGGVHEALVLPDGGAVVVLGQVGDGAPLLREVGQVLALALHGAVRLLLQVGDADGPWGPPGSLQLDDAPVAVGQFHVVYLLFLGIKIAAFGLPGSSRRPACRPFVMVLSKRDNSSRFH